MRHRYLPIDRLIKLKATGMTKSQNESGIYFLFLGNEIVYIGQSQNIYRRYRSHRSQKNFDSIAWVKVEGHCQRLHVENYYLEIFKPKLNIRGNPVFGVFRVKVRDSSRLRLNPLPSLNTETRTIGA